MSPLVVDHLHGALSSTSQDIKIIKKVLNGYVGFANLPKQWHRRSLRRGFTLNIMAVGEAGLGKATLINTLFNRDVMGKSGKLSEFEDDQDEDFADAETEPLEKEGEAGVRIKNTKAEIEEDGVKLKVSVITAPGFGEALNNIDSWKPIVDEINSRFDSYLEAESRINRSTIVDRKSVV